MLQRFSTRRIVAFFLIDWLGALVALRVAAYLRLELGSLPESLAAIARALGISIGWARTLFAGGGMLPPQVYGLVALIWPFSLLAFGLYDGHRNETLGVELRNAFMAVCVGMLMLAGALFFSYRETSRLMLLMFFLLDVALVVGARGALWVYRRTPWGRRPAWRRAVLVIGAGPVGQRVVEQLRKYGGASIDLVGYVDDDRRKQGHAVDGLPVLGPVSQVAALVEARQVSDAVVALPLRAHERLLETCQVLQRLSVSVHVVPDLFALSFPGARLDGFGGIPVMYLGRPGLGVWQELSRRVFDLTAATVLVVLLSPLLLLTAILVRLESPGPAIYRQERVGVNGRLFTMLKFRSMRVDADPDVHKAYVRHLIVDKVSPSQVSDVGNEGLKLKNDARVTRVGRVIRKLSIDELPQLFNVLRGEMSLVGPRPHLPYEVELYEEWQRRRLTALPGITGWWQVKGRNRVAFDEMVRMDIWYIEHMSLWLDLKILLMTPWAAISGKGAA